MLAESIALHYHLEQIKHLTLLNESIRNLQFKSIVLLQIKCTVFSILIKSYSEDFPAPKLHPNYITYAI